MTSVRGTRTLLARAAYEAMTLAARWPAIVLPAARLRGHGVPLDGGTALVIEGFPRSGNSFAVAAFGLAQQRAVAVAHHLHAPGHVTEAVRRRLPTLVLVRDPEEAVTAWLGAKPLLTPTQAVRGYVRFYAPLVPLRDRFVVARFDQVMADLGAVIRRLNDRFGTDFDQFEHSEQNVRASFEAIERQRRARSGPGLPLVGRTRPDDAPQGVDAPPGEGAGVPLPAAPLARARRLFQILAATSGPA